MRTAAARSVRSRSPPISVPSSSSASSSPGAASAVRCTASRPASWPRAVSSTELRPVRGSSPRTEASSATSSSTISARCRDNQSCQASPACAGSGLPGPLTPHSRPSSSSISFRVRGAPSSRRARTWTRPSGKLPASRWAARTASADFPTPAGPDTTSTAPSGLPDTSRSRANSSSRPVKCLLSAGSDAPPAALRGAAARAARPSPSIARYRPAIAGLGSRPSSRASSCR